MGKWETNRMKGQMDKRLVPIQLGIESYNKNVCKGLDLKL